MSTAFPAGHDWAPPAFAAGLGLLLACFTGEHVGEPRLLIALYGPPPLHVDLKFVADRDLDDRVEDGLVLWQRDGAVEAALRRAEAVWPRPPDPSGSRSASGSGSTTAPPRWGAASCSSAWTCSPPSAGWCSGR